MHPRYSAVLSWSLLLVAGLCGSAGAADWPVFRGPERTGLCDDPKLPLEWGKDKNIKWSAALPSPGNSSPIVSGGRVFVSCAQDKKGKGRSLFCFDRTSGKQLWVKTVEYAGNEPSHDANPYCGSTPAADGERVVVWHGSAGLHCYDYEGKELWSRDLGEFKHIWGYAASPIFYGDSIILNCGPGTRSFLIAVNRRDGKTLWQTEEPGGADNESPKTHTWLGSWTTPIVVKSDGKDVLVLTMPSHVNAYDPATGKIVWTCEGTGPLSYADAMEADGTIVAMAGYAGAAIGFKPGGMGDITTSARLWRETAKIPQRIGTGVVVGKYLYMVSEPGFQCIEIETGKEMWRHYPGGRFWSSLVGTSKRVYATSQGGDTVVFSPDPKEYKELAVNSVGEGTNATLALSNGQIFLRTYTHLYCIEEK